MTTTNPIPLDTFTTALESLDTNALTELTAETYAETADAIKADPPRVTVVNGDRQTELLVVSSADKHRHSESVDAVVYTRSSPPADSAPADTEIVTPADLRQRLLYSMSPAAANDIAARTLDVPIHSAEYDDPTAGDAAANVTPTDGETASKSPETKPIDADTENGLHDNPPTGTDQSLSSTSAATAASDGVAAGSSPDGTAEAEPTQRRTSDAGSSNHSQTEKSRPPESQRDRSYPVTLIALIVAVALLAGMAGAASVAVTDVDSRLGFGSDPATDASTADTDATTQNDDAGGVTTPDDDTNTAGATNDSNTTSITEREVERITSVSPTCKRSAIHVVQLQMNAFRYNNNTTNDGIRTARSFSSPANKRAVGSIEQFIEVLNTPQYAPMLTYDSVQYSVPEVNENTAEIDIVTLENNSVTGRYRFRLSRVSGESVDTDEHLDDTDSCWMTSGVVTLPE